MDAWLQRIEQKLKSISALGANDTFLDLTERIETHVDNIIRVFQEQRESLQLLASAAARTSLRLAEIDQQVGSAGHPFEMQQTLDNIARDVVEIGRCAGAKHTTSITLLSSQWGTFGEMQSFLEGNVNLRTLETAMRVTTSLVQLCLNAWKNAASWEINGKCHTFVAKTLTESSR